MEKAAAISVLSDRNYRLLVGITCLLGISAAALGPALRYASIAPVNFDYRNLMHAHSHTMLMGWLFNGFILAFCRRIFQRMPCGLFWGMLLTSLLAAMQLALFPGHGYDRTIIMLLVLYTLASYYVLYEVYSAARKLNPHGLSRLLIFIAILFYLLSTFCLFGLGPWTASFFRFRGGYDLLIQLYLHFQYNGFFWFAFLALLGNGYSWINKPFNRFACFLMAGGALLLTGFLTWRSLGTGIAAGATGGAVQLLAGFMLLSINRFRRPGFLLGIITGLAVLKLLLQPAGFSPDVARAVLETRPLMVAWLHFSFLALYTPLIWQSLSVKKVPAKLWAAFWIALAISLAGLVAPYLFPRIPLALLLYLNWWNFIAAILLFLFLSAITVLLIAAYCVKLHRNF